MGDKLHSLDPVEKREHLIFQDDDDEDDDEEDKVDEDKVDVEEEDALASTISDSSLKSKRNRERLESELAERRARIQKLSIVEAELELHKKLSCKGKRFKTGTDSKGIPIYRWRSERKK